MSRIVGFGVLSCRKRLAICPSFEINGDGCQRDGAGVPDKASVSSSGKTVDIFEQAEERLDSATVFANARIAADFCRRERAVVMTSAHDAIADATQGEVLSPFSAVVSFVGIDDLLVTADQMVGLLAFVDVGRRDKNATDDATGLVHRCM